MSYQTTHRCPSCQTESTVTVWPFQEAITDGPAEDWQPEEGGEVEPVACPECDHAISYDDVKEEGDE